MRQAKESGMTVVELLITLFVASAFLISGYQLYTVIIRDGGEARAQARASSVVDEYLKRYELEATSPCSEQSPVVDEVVEGEGLAGATITVNIKCPYISNPEVSRVEVVLTYGTAGNVVATAGYVSSELDPSLVAWWPMNGNANDLSGNGLNGAVDGASLTTGQNDQDDSAYSFDGSNDFISIPNSDLINTGTSYDAKTISLWFYSNSNSGKRVLYEQGGGSRGLNLYIDDGNLYMGVWNNANDGPNTPWGPYYLNSSVNTGVWHNAVLVFSQSDNAVTGYLDGSSIGQLTGLGLLFSHANDNGIGQVAGNTLFHDGQASSAQFYNGRIDDIRAYNRALSVSEVEGLYAAGAW